LLNFCESKNIGLYSLPNNFHIAVDQKEVGTYAGIPIMLLRDAAVRPTYALVKRCMDIVVSSAVLLLGLPLWILIALLIKRHDGGPVFFIQTRAGLHGRPFPMVKFRSMSVDAEEKLGELVDLDGLEEPVFKIENDPRVTPIGRFLRRTSLDEMPQLLNVFKGEMSLVGPRPEETAVVERYTPWQRRRLKAVPGITGHQQIHNRGEPSLVKRVQHDLIYIKHQSLLLDLYILFKTVKVVLSGKGVTH
jgi:exopolysaccharide biosynthesis polyprenyl glycosylphosphotransferase